MNLPIDRQQDRVVSSSSRYDHPALLCRMGHLNIVLVAIHLQPSRPKREYSRPRRFHLPPRLFLGTWHNSPLFRFLPSLAISFQVPSPQASEIRSIWRLSPRTETRGLDLFLQSSDDFPNRMFCPGLSIIRPDRFPEISLFVTSWKLSIRKEINGQVASLIFRVSRAPSISRFIDKASKMFFAFRKLFWSCLKRRLHVGNGTNVLGGLLRSFKNLDLYLMFLRVHVTGWFRKEKTR
jgi:hypothetical protein